MENSRLDPYFLRVRASAAAARGDTSVADSCWRALGAMRSIWQWEALRSRADLMLASGEAARADSLLEGADRDDWPDLERAAWLVRRAMLRAALGDTLQAIEFSRQVIRKYPSLAPAARAIADLETLLGARGGRLSAEDEAAAAEVDAFRSDLDGAARRLRRALAEATPKDWRTGVRLAEILRQRNRFSEAMKAVDEATAVAPGGAERARCLLELARIHRDQGDRERAYAAYAEVGRSALDSAVCENAWWEAGQEAEQAAEWRRARSFYLMTAACAGRRRDEAGLRVGLLWLAEGASDSARAAWEAIDTEGARFWSAVLGRGTDRATADSLLVTLAALPGYGFYRAAARETLGLKGWTGEVARDSCPEDFSCEGLAVARDLVLYMKGEDAAAVISRWASGDPRFGARGRAGLQRDALALLSASRLAYAAGFLPAGIRYARLAADAAAARPAEDQWGVHPWMYPPAFESLYAAFPESAAADGIERALVRAVTWQESKFDPAARSRSNALGLMQLKLATASDVARWLREAPPTEAKLRDPQTNLRYGVAYLRRLLERCDGKVSAALAAYNAGPGRIGSSWRLLEERGGEALVCELVGYPETRDYVKRIIGARQAYRELRPVASR